MSGEVWGSSDALLIIIRSPAAADGTPLWCVCHGNYYSEESQSDTCLNTRYDTENINLHILNTRIYSTFISKKRQL